MKYDFTSIIDRKGMDALAVDAINPGCPIGPSAPLNNKTVIPMWVADMNFKTAPSVTAEISKRLEHPLFGYFFPREEYFSSIINWQSKNNAVTGLTPECISYENGVLGGVINSLNVLCSKGDKVLVHTPTYCGFTHCLEANGYHIVHSPLTPVEGVWRMDFEDMERKIVDNKIHAAIFCSPHNPCGRVWERWEIEKALDIYRRHDVYVVSDEIWSDIILSGHKHIPTQSVSEDARMRTIALYAPTKTFNLAGLIGSYNIIYNSYLRDRTKKETELCHYNSMNVLSMYSLIGAYSDEGREWADEMCEVITSNVNLACEFFATNTKGVTVCKPQGTYMLFVDFSEWLQKHSKTLPELLQMMWDEGVAVQSGIEFNSNVHLRMNLALPQALLLEALNRMKAILQ